MPLRKILNIALMFREIYSSLHTFFFFAYIYLLSFLLHFVEKHISVIPFYLSFLEFHPAFIDPFVGKHRLLPIGTNVGSKVCSVIIKCGCSPSPTPLQLLTRRPAACQSDKILIKINIIATITYFYCASATNHSASPRQTVIKQPFLFLIPPTKGRSLGSMPSSSPEEYKVSMADLLWAPFINHPI